MEPWGETAGGRLRQAGLAGRETREETTQARQVPPGREDNECKGARGATQETFSLGSLPNLLEITDAFESSYETCNKV